MADDKKTNEQEYREARQALIHESIQAERAGDIRASHEISRVIKIADQGKAQQEQKKSGS